MLYTDKILDEILKQWSRPFKEVDGYRWVETEKGTTLVLNALGISKEDLEIRLEQENSLIVKGETTIDNLEVDNKVNYNFRLTEKFINRIKELNYDVKDGLVYIDFILKPSTVNKIKITQKK